MQEIIKAEMRTEKYFEEKCFITEIINTPEFNLCSLSKAKVAAGITTELHCVNDTAEVYYLLAGAGEMEIDGKITGNVEEGDTVFIEAGKSQRIKNIRNEDLVFLCICSPRFELENYRKLS